MMSNLTPVQNNLPVASNYVTQMLSSIKEDFLAVNSDMDFDFVNIGTWLNISKKGNFVEKDGNDQIVADYGDRIDVVVAHGEKRWTLWGKQESPEAGQLIVAKKDRGEAEIELQSYLQENPEAQTRYDLKSLELRYLAYVVPIATLRPDGFPKIYLMSFPSTTTIQWGKYAQNIYLGKGIKAEVPARTGVNRIVTRMTTAEKGSGDKSWIGIDFEAVGMFDPQDYGIDWKADANAAAPVASFAQPVAEAKVAAGAEPY